MPIALVLTGLAMFGVINQHRQLSKLRADQQGFLKRTNSAEKEITQPSVSSSSRPSAELLELRSKVTQLMARKTVLTGAQTENETLHSQLAARGTNSSSGALPPGYVRASQARWVGQSTPESTVQSFLWALRNRDTNALFQILDTKSAEELRRALETSPEDFIAASVAFPGMRITDQRPAPDGSLEAKIEIMPGESMSRPARFHLDQGQWRINLDGH